MPNQPPPSWWPSYQNSGASNQHIQSQQNNRKPPISRGRNIDPKLRWDEEQFESDRRVAKIAIQSSQQFLESWDKRKGNKKEKQLAFVNEYFKGCFQVVINERNTLFFVDKGTYYCRFFDDEEIFLIIKNIYYQNTGEDLSQVILESVRDNVRGEALNANAKPSRQSHHFVRISDYRGISLNSQPPDFLTNLNATPNVDRILLRLDPVQLAFVEVDSKKITFHDWRQSDQPFNPIHLFKAEGAQGYPEDWSLVEETNPFKLFEVTHLPKDKDLLILAWLVNAMQPLNPQVLLQINGLPLTGKTTVTKILRTLLDPHMNAVVDLPATSLKLTELYDKHYCLCFDEVESISREVQKELISLLKGYTLDLNHGKGVKREFSVRRPVILIAEEDVIKEEKLKRNTLAIELGKVKNPTHGHEHEVVNRGPKLNQVFCGLLHLVKNYLAFDQLRDLSEDERVFAASFESGMSSLCLIGLFLEKHYHREPGSFRNQLESIEQENILNELLDNPVAFALLNYLKDSPGELFERSVKHWLNILSSPENLKEPSWPPTERALGAEFKRLAPDLERLGMICSPSKNKTRKANRYWEIGVPEEAAHIFEWLID